MPRTPQAFHAPDISALARSLKQQWAAHEGPPSHLQLMNMLARATGHQNHQHWKVAAPASQPLSSPPNQALEPSPSPAPKLEPGASQHPKLDPSLARLLRHFDAQGRMKSWPSKHSDQVRCLWALATSLPGQGQHPESQINACLQAAACFGDHVLLRRELVNQGHLGRTPDGRSYWRLRQDLPTELIPLVVEVRQRLARS